MPARSCRHGPWGDALSGAGRPASGCAGSSRDDDHYDDIGAGAGVAGPFEAGSDLVPGSLPRTTLTAYTQDLKAYLGWCQTYNREVLQVSRGEVEIYVRHLEGRGYAAATVAYGSAPWRRSTSTPSSAESSRPTQRPWCRRDRARKADGASAPQLARLAA